MPPKKVEQGSKLVEHYRTHPGGYIKTIHTQRKFHWGVAKAPKNGPFCAKNGPFCAKNGPFCAKLDQGALGMLDPSPVSHQQGDQAIRNTRFIMGHQKQRRICTASPAVHHLRCITCSASPAVHHLQCITYGASPPVHLRCI